MTHTPSRSLLRGLAALGALCAAPLAARAQTPTAAPAPAAGVDATFDRVVAVAGSQPILASEVEQEIIRRRAGNPKFVMPTDSAGMLTLRRDALNDLIDQQLLLQKAKAEKIEVAEADVAPNVDARIKEIRGSYASDAEYRAKLVDAGLGSPEEYRNMLLEQARNGAMIERLIGKLREDSKFTAPPVTDAMVASYFADGKIGEQHRPAQVAFRQIVVTPTPTAAERATARAKADSILAEIRKGADFEQAAKRYSEDPGSKELGGDLGWNRRGTMVPEFDRVMFSLPPGRVSNIVETVYGYHIIRVDRVQPSEVKARHILIKFPLDSNDVVRARKSADSVVAALRAGASFDTLAARYKDPEEERAAPLMPISDLPPSYQTAVAGKKAGDIVDPFAIADPRRGSKFMVLLVTQFVPEGDLTLADVRTQLRTALTEEAARKRLIGTLRKEMYVSVRL